MPSSRLVYEFGDFRLDVTRRSLLLRRDARALPLTSRAFDTLLYLVEHRGELVDKATLMKAVWPGVVVEENNLNQNISLLRRVLGECPGEYRFIVTVPGRGYRFIAEVRTINELAHGASPSVPGTGAGSQPRTGVLARTAIAVLPFANLTADPDKDRFGDAMAQELINTLVRVRWFRVASTTSAFAYKGRTADVRQIARELEVEAIVEGSIRSAGEAERITAQLVDGRTGHHLWSESYERSGRDLSTVQDELTVAIVDAIASYFVMAIARKTPTRDLEAFHLYLRAMALRAQPTRHNMETATQLLERAIARDPSFARAWYALAEGRAHRVASGSCSARLASDAERDARRALQLDPSISSAYAVLGLLNAYRGRWLEAEAELRNASALVPKNPETLALHAVYVAAQAGHRHRALSEILSAYDLAPASLALTFHVGAQHLLAGEDAEAHKWIDAAVASGYPRSLDAVHDARAHVAMRQGRFADAEQELTEAMSPAARSDGGFEAIQLFYASLSDASRKPAAVAALTAWETSQRAGDLNRLTAQRLMLWFTMLGAIDTAHDVGHHILDRFAPCGAIGCGWGILWMPEMQPFRASLRFQALVSRLGLVEYWRHYGPPDGYALQGGSLRPSFNQPSR